uniref:Tripartite motif containing 39 n=1 Tax=Terrapene triunguis TaxID=2587831 RepID=A0A674JQX4_9SAUR
MAAGDLAWSFQDEVTCFICLEYFADPVTIECGHNFCRACISQCWGESEPNFSCPQCRETTQQRNLWPNRQLGNVVELVKRLRLQTMTEPEGEQACEWHQEALKLFCEEDQTLICMICRESWAHHTHTVIPIEEAAQQYRVGNSNLHGWDWVERQLMVSKCERLRQFLAEQEPLLLARLGEPDEEIGRRREENATRLCEEISQLSALITELEGKCQQLVPELLQLRLSQRLKGTQVNFPLIPVTSPCPPGSDSVTLSPVDVTLDPDTAHPKLVLSEDRKHVRSRDTCQDLPDNPEIFDTHPCVLGAEGFTGGRRYWEVEVEGKIGWYLGVCRESVSRKGKVTLTPEDGYWVVWLKGEVYQALTSPSTSLPVSIRPSRVGIFLDYEAGEVSFYNVTDSCSRSLCLHLLF